MSLRTMVVRRCTHETLPDSVSDPHGENAGDYGEAEGPSHYLNTCPHILFSLACPRLSSPCNRPVLKTVRDYDADTARVDM